MKGGRKRGKEEREKGGMGRERQRRERERRAGKLTARIWPVTSSPV
jgi:hypothetical protein